MSDPLLRRPRPPASGLGACSIVFGLVAWLLAEVLLRVLFFALPPRLQLVLEEVRVTPFTERRLLPDPIWQPDIDYLTIARPVTDFEQFGSAEVRFTVTTEQLWDQRGAFRTRQALVDRYVDGVVVGDSFAFCFTDADDCWVNRLAQQTEHNLINLGMVSTGSVAHLRVLEDYGLPLRPPLVIWQWYGNDANEDYGLAQLRGEAQTPPGDDTPPSPSEAGSKKTRRFMCWCKCCSAKTIATPRRCNSSTASGRRTAICGSASGAVPVGRVRSGAPAERRGLAVVAGCVSHREGGSRATAGIW